MSPHHGPSVPERRRARRDPDDERLDEEDDTLPHKRPHAGPADEGEQPQSPGARPLHKTQQQQH